VRDAPVCWVLTHPARAPGTRRVHRRTARCVPAPSPRRAGTRRGGEPCHRIGGPTTRNHARAPILNTEPSERRVAARSTRQGVAAVPTCRRRNDGSLAQRRARSRDACGLNGGRGPDLLSLQPSRTTTSRRKRRWQAPIAIDI
jgi:hypothetical protein